MSDRTARISSSVEEDFKQELRVEAAKRGMSMSELVYIALHSEFGDMAKVLEEIEDGSLDADDDLASSLSELAEEVDDSETADTSC